MTTASEKMCLSFLHSTNSHWAPSLCSALMRAGLHRAGHGRLLQEAPPLLERRRKTFSKQCQKYMTKRDTVSQKNWKQTPQWTFTKDFNPQAFFGLFESLLASKKRTNEESINTINIKYEYGSVAIKEFLLFLHHLNINRKLWLATWDEWLHALQHLASHHLQTW